MKKYLLLCTALTISPSAYAALNCAIPPTCEALGYKQTASDCAGQFMLKCPFDDNAVFCGGSSCSSGQLFIDGSCRKVYTSCNNAGLAGIEDVSNPACTLQGGDEMIYLTDGSKIDCWLQSCDMGCDPGEVWYSSLSACHATVERCADEGYATLNEILDANGNLINENCRSDEADYHPYRNVDTRLDCWASSCTKAPDDSSSSSSSDGGANLNGSVTSTCRDASMEYCFEYDLLQKGTISIALLSQEECYDKYVKALLSVVENDFGVYRG
ncbi:MAG: hypothetical protein E7020_06100 [Alphaproteobacteria bacterium]|nr:hypothetical protein [Alphaproteobacteria bacterium]